MDDRDDQALREALRPSWMVPIAGGAAELLVVVVVTAVGAYYDHINRLPGPLVGLGMALLTTRWVILGRLQWAAARHYLTTIRRRPPTEVQRATERAVKRHGREVVLRALEGLDLRRELEATVVTRAEVEQKALPMKPEPKS